MWFREKWQTSRQKTYSPQKPFVIIDKKPLENRDDEFRNTIFIHGNAVEDEILIKAGVEKANGIIACLPSDADNLFIVISSKELNQKLKSSVELLTAVPSKIENCRCRKCNYA